MVRRSHRLKLGHTRQEKDCKETIELQNLCATNGRKELYCGEHRRKLELFCQKDETFICVLCVPRHSNHRFVLVHEAVSLYKEKLNTALTSLESKVNMALMCLASKVKGLKYFQNKQGNRLIDIQEDAFSLEQYIKQAFAKLHQFLQGKKMKLVQQLTNKGHIAENLKDMEEKNRCNESKVTATQRTANNNVELLEQEPICLGEGDAFSLEQCIKQEFAKLLKSLLDKEHKLIQQLKNEEANFLNEMRVNLECSKHDDSASCMAVSNATLDPSHKESEILKEKSKSIESYITMTEETFHSNLEFRRQEPDGLLTVPETFEDVTITFSEEEWKMLNKHDKEIYREVMVNNYETMVSVGYRIPKKKLLLLLKANNEMSEGDVGEKYATENRDNVKGTSSTEYSMSYNQQSLFGTSQLQHPSKNLQQCPQPVKGPNKVHLTPVPQLNSGPNYSKNSECDTSMRCHTGTKLCKCTECSRSFTHKSQMKYIPSSHIGDKPYNCTECGKRFMYKSQLKYHGIYHTGEKPYKCVECGKCFRQKVHLKSHQNSHTGERPYKCTECSKCFARFSHLQCHQAIHTGEKPYKCTECTKCFICKAQLKCHQYSHMAEKVNTCTEGSTCFTDLSSLQLCHITHTVEKPYKCTECSKCFLYQSQLKYHQSYHTGVRPYKCAECGKCFRQKVHLKNHQATHSGERPYKCAECSKCFLRRCSLQYHQAVHAGEKPYKCSECSKCFIFKSQLKYHQSSHTDLIS
ncbi:zinc finger protein 25-like isoform X2 [Protopterus annectens]|uniref:zinc finger protein 25-like isoform X2 n=1 Tax=Protopterus annectens TaxID=7888 RepID=UPI001CF977B0|nr:zinc finger protein 25-like isoform X2 [Protopterus annectens]